MKGQQFDAERVIKDFGGQCSTKGGRHVTQLHLFACSDDEIYPLVGVVDGLIRLWAADGREWASGQCSDNDLIMPRHV